MVLPIKFDFSASTVHTMRLNLRVKKIGLCWACKTYFYLACQQKEIFCRTFSIHLLQFCCSLSHMDAHHLIWRFSKIFNGIVSINTFTFLIQNNTESIGKWGTDLRSNLLVNYWAHWSYSYDIWAATTICLLVSKFLAQRTNPRGYASIGCDIDFSGKYF